jgi:RNA polymerase sigma-70 factor (ECF subfamily)
VNGSLGVVLRVAGQPVSVVTLEVADGRITTVRNVANPDKMAHLAT